MSNHWNSLTPKELKTAKRISFIFLLITFFIYLFLNNIAAMILFGIWIVFGSAPFLLSSKKGIENEISTLKIIEPGYNYWSDEEIKEQLKTIKECGYVWFQKKGRIGFKNKKTKLYLKIEGLNFYKPDEIKKTFDEVWSKQKKI